MVDAGGGTIDVSAYVVEKVQKLSVKELFAPECEISRLTYFYTSELASNRSDAWICNRYEKGR